MSESEPRVELTEDAAWIAAALVLVASLGGAVVLAEWPLWGVSLEDREDPQLVAPAENGTELWPYTSKRRGFDGRTLGVNMVFYGDPDDVHTALTRRAALEWTEETLPEEEVDDGSVAHEPIVVNRSAENVTGVISWQRARGSTRYTYVEVDGEGRWLEESYQLHAGTYFGARQHVRAYEDPQGEWTAVQIHGEHWDWFRLRHTVMGISDAQRELEREFMGEPYVDEVVRMPFENGTADSDGWVTGIYLAGLLAPLVAFGVAVRTRRAKRVTTRFLRRRRRELVLGAGQFALYTGVRYAGIGAELLLPALSPKVIAAVLYFVLVVGTPAVAYLLAKGTEPSWAFAFAALGLGSALVVDFAAMGVSVVPLRVVLHRGAVLLAVGLVALGGALASDPEEVPRPLVVGLVGWGVALFAPLFGYL